MMSTKQRRIIDAYEAALDGEPPECVGILMLLSAIEAAVPDASPGDIIDAIRQSAKDDEARMYGDKGKPTTVDGSDRFRCTRGRDGAPVVAEQLNDGSWRVCLNNRERGRVLTRAQAEAFVAHLAERGIPRHEPEVIAARAPKPERH
jgi:hypothetical protein